MGADPGSKNRRLYVVLGGFGLLAGLATASLVSNAMFNTAAAEPGFKGVTVAPSATAKPTPTDTVTAVPTDTPTPEPTHSVTPTPVPTHSGGTTHTGGSTGGSTHTGGGSTGGGSTTPKSCPDTRSENPTLWDACRAGYIAPTIKFEGLVACKAVDRANGVWAVTEKFSIVGGVYRKATWSGLSNNTAGTTVWTIHSVPVSDLNQPTIITGTEADLQIWSMNGVFGIIDTIHFSADPTVTLSSVCS
jgi:hypothetical protein